MEPDYNFLKNTLIANPIDYKKIKEDNIVITYVPEEKYDINFIIPVRGRVSFLKPMYNAFKKAAENSELKISLTVSEHSFNPEHSHFCKQNKINYIWIKAEEKQPFNKCLAMNMGAIYSPQTNNFLFHDLDCLIQSDFFIKLLENIKNKECKAIQCFHGRRVLYLNDELTNKVIAEQIDIDTFKLGMAGINLPYAIGAPGGSIFVDKNLFFEVGGYDPELFYSNAPEDVFFWDKIDEVSKMEISDNPEIDLFHMNHPVTYHDNPKINDMLFLSRSFKVAKPEQKREFVNLKKEALKEFYYE